MGSSAAAAAAGAAGAAAAALGFWDATATASLAGRKSLSFAADFQLLSVCSEPSSAAATKSRNLGADSRHFDTAVASAVATRAADLASLPLTALSQASSQDADAPPASK